MSPSTTKKRPVRIVGCSGGFTDRSRVIASLDGDPDVEAVIGDWMAEMTMTMHGSGKIKNQQKLSEDAKVELSLEDRMKTAMYAETFLQCFEPAIDNLAKNKCKLAVNAGASDTVLLAQVCQKMVREAGYDLKIAWAEGDDVTSQVNALIKQGEQFERMEEPICAQAYLGRLGIAEAFRQGADIVICGRVADAAPVIGLAAWWHEWTPDMLDELAGALIAGHSIECSAYVTGGYYSGFKDFIQTRGHLNMGFPIAEVDYKGECIIVKEKNTGGAVNVGTVASQLLYQIQGRWHYNCDVVADITAVKMTHVGQDAVHVSGIKGLPPPPTRKCRATEGHIRYAIGDNIDKFTTLKFHQNGSSLSMRGTRTLRLLISESSRRARIPNNDIRQVVPKPYYEYWVSLLPQSEFKHRVHCLFADTKVVDMPAPRNTRVYPKQQPSYETEAPVALSTWGETARVPLGYVVLGRSGDKASDCNVGFFVRNDDEWEWLRSFLTVDKIKELLGLEEYKGKLIDRFEIPGIKAVHFLLHDHLDRGYNGCSTYDTLGKNACEYIRAKTVDIPTKFLDRGRI
ncbi:hypothetical protein B0T10DRAFT_530604 [Thelonectria olida]|uniref:DUF1446-domain-containing protein n=1 Tax=Thelonectria olida TaxID=1576542 RepID=A0A9P8W015_9HYPO|nr:hypothetical protein B0T10DRAFT_530604 [Thelonectria olida]